MAWKSWSAEDPSHQYLMKIISTIARLLLGLIFVVFGLNFFLHFIPMPPPPADFLGVTYPDDIGKLAGQPVNHVGLYFGAMFPTGILKFVHVLEILGGVLLLVGKLVNLGLTILGPIVVNILLFHFLVAGGGFGVPIAAAVLGLVALAGQKEFTRAVFAP